ncbi:Electron transfer flavoprotein, partial [Aspergillus sp. HF37]
RPPRTDLGRTCRVGWARPGLQGAVRDDRTAGRQAGRRRRCIARGSRFGLCPERLAGGPDRQGRGAGALRRGRHFRCDPALGRHEGQQGHRGHQQGRGSADLP